jgi:replication factor C small subunit
MNKELWVEAYRPKTVDECILPDDLINRFKGYLREQTIPNLILSGASGVGKTTVALAMLNEYDCDYIKINSALKKGIETIRDEVLEFASTVSFKGKKKYVIFDEADGMQPNAQKALNAFIEQFSENCGYIFIVNNEKKLIPELHSRCQLVDFTIPKEDFPYLAKAFYARLALIFAENGVEFAKQVVGPVIKRHYPDWRKMLITFQDYAIHHEGKIDAGILATRDGESYTEVINLLRTKNWEGLRKWVGENPHVYMDFSSFAVKLVKEIEECVDNHNFPVMYYLVNEYDFRNYFTSDKQVNTIVFLTKLMTDISWRNK